MTVFYLQHQIPYLCSTGCRKTGKRGDADKCTGKYRKETF